MKEKGGPAYLLSNQIQLIASRALLLFNAAVLLPLLETCIGVVVGLLAVCWHQSSSLNTPIEGMEVPCKCLPPELIFHVAAVQRHKIVFLGCYQVVDVLLQQAVDAVLHDVQYNDINDKW